MKNKGFLLSLFIAGSLTANAQDIKEWLSLTPIKMEKPALSHVKNVKDQVFTDAMLTDYSGVNIGSLVPDADSKENHFHRLRWTVAPMNRDTVTAGEKTDQPTLNYYAVYFSNSEWILATPLTLKEPTIERLAMRMIWLSPSPDTMETLPSLSGRSPNLVLANSMKRRLIS